MPPTDFLVFGEDDSDRRAIAHIIKAVIPKATKARVTPIRKPVILARDAHLTKRAKMSDAIAAIARGYEGGKRSPTVVVHRDCDAIEPAHEQATALLEKDLSEAGVKSFAVATPAWEMEAWWMLFPEALGEICKGWNKVNYGKQHVGKFQNAKEKLIKDLRPTGKQSSCRDYRESDGVSIAELLVKDNSHLAKLEARSDSFTAFRGKLLALCES